MARYTKWAAALTLLSVAACGSNPPPVAVTPAPPPPPTLQQADQTFVQNAAASDAFEVQSSQIVLEKSHSAALKQLAQHMVQDHTQSTQQLIQILQSKSITPPAVQLSQDQQDALTKLKASKGAALDKLYEKTLLQGHEAALQGIQQEETAGQDDAVKAFAQQLQPVVEKHIEMLHHLMGDKHAGKHHGHADHHHHHHAAKSADQ